MNSNGKTIIGSFASIKGGVGRTHILILLARCLAAAGKKVLKADSDLNNSLSFHDLEEAMMEKTRKLNFAAALSDESNNLREFAVPTTTPGVDLIASTPYLADLRTLSENRLKRMIPTLYGEYDIMLIDCHPTYDNIVLNALRASDYIITPVFMDMFSYNAAAFMNRVLRRDLGSAENWFVLINGYNRRHEDSKSGRQSDFLKLYAESEEQFPLTPKETWLPWTAHIHQVIDYRKKLAGVPGIPGSAYCPELYSAITELAGCFFDDALVIPEVF